jgi:hypothetical protein
LDLKLGFERADLLAQRRLLDAEPGRRARVIWPSSATATK